LRKEHRNEPAEKWLQEHPANALRHPRTMNQELMQKVMAKRQKVAKASSGGNDRQ
jgi:hypothetical protein